MMKDETKTKKQLINELVELRKQTEKLKAKVAKSEGIDDRLKASEEQFKMLFVNAPLAYQSLDEKGNILDVNREWLNILGYSKEEVVDHHFTEFISPDDINYFKNCFPLFIKKERVEEIKFEMVRKDGIIIIVSFFGNIQRDAKGLFQRTHCIFQDITKHKRLEEQLLHARKMESIGTLYWYPSRRYCQ
jgi:PAS domain S-box-containing protein